MYLFIYAYKSFFGILLPWKNKYILCWVAKFGKERSVCTGWSAFEKLIETQDYHYEINAGTFDSLQWMEEWKLPHLFFIFLLLICFKNLYAEI